jgi:hypothetical protein
MYKSYSPRVYGKWTIDRLADITVPDMQILLFEKEIKVPQN